MVALVAGACGSSTKTAATGGTTGPTAAASTGSTAAITPTDCVSPAGASGPGVGATTVGFIYVGATTDFGYNEAAHAGEQQLKAACPNLKFLEADEIPETSNMVTVADQMIGEGAKIIFSTSYGYEPYAVTLAKANPNVVFLQQGNLITPPVAPNINTYFGDVWQTVYLGGIAAAKATTSDKLGFVAAFPIPQTIVNIDAFELGAQSVNPAITTTVVFTGAWCDPAMQAQATTSLLGQGVDVMTQHQDCTSTVIKTAEAARRLQRRLPLRRPATGPQGLAHRVGMELGPAVPGPGQEHPGGNLRGRPVQHQLHPRVHQHHHPVAPDAGPVRPVGHGGHQDADRRRQVQDPVGVVLALHRAHPRPVGRGAGPGGRDGHGRPAERHLLPGQGRDRNGPVMCHVVKSIRGKASPS